MSSAKLSRNFPFALQPELVLKTADSRFSQFWNAYTLITSTSAPIVTLFSDVQPAKAYLSISSINSKRRFFQQQVILECPFNNKIWLFRIRRSSRDSRCRFRKAYIFPIFRPRLSHTNRRRRLLCSYSPKNHTNVVAQPSARCGSDLGAAESVNSVPQNTQRNFPPPMSRHSPPQDLHSTVCLLNRFALSTQAIFLCRRFERTTLRVRKPFPNLRFSTSFRPFQLRAMPTVLPPCPTAQLCPNR